MARDGTKRGGRRAGSGRKPDQRRVEFREFLRGKFTADQDKLYALAWSLAEDDGQASFLNALVGQAFGAAPQAIQLSTPGAIPVVVSFGTLASPGGVSGAQALPAGVPRGDES